MLIVRIDVARVKKDLENVNGYCDLMNGVRGTGSMSQRIALYSGSSGIQKSSTPYVRTASGEQDL